MSTPQQVRYVTQHNAVLAKPGTVLNASRVSTPNIRHLQPRGAMHQPQQGLQQRALMQQVIYCLTFSQSDHCDQYFSRCIFLLDICNTWFFQTASLQLRQQNERMRFSQNHLPKPVMHSQPQMTNQRFPNAPNPNLKGYVSSVASTAPLKPGGRKPKKATARGGSNSTISRADNVSLMMADASGKIQAHSFNLSGATAVVQTQMVNSSQPSHNATNSQGGNQLYRAVVSSSPQTTPATFANQPMTAEQIQQQAVIRAQQIQASTQQMNSSQQQYAMQPQSQLQQGARMTQQVNTSTSHHQNMPQQQHQQRGAKYSLDTLVEQSSLNGRTGQSMSRNHRMPMASVAPNQAANRMSVTSQGAQRGQRQPGPNQQQIQQHQQQIQQQQQHKQLTATNQSHASQSFPSTTPNASNTSVSYMSHQQQQLSSAAIQPANKFHSACQEEFMKSIQGADGSMSQAPDNRQSPGGVMAPPPPPSATSTPRAMPPQQHQGVGALSQSQTPQARFSMLPPGQTPQQTFTPPPYHQQRAPHQQQQQQRNSCSTPMSQQQQQMTEAQMRQAHAQARMPPPPNPPPQASTGTTMTPLDPNAAGEMASPSPLPAAASGSNLVANSEYLIQYSNGRKVVGIWDGKFFKIKNPVAG